MLMISYTINNQIFKYAQNVGSHVQPLEQALFSLLYVFKVKPKINAWSGSQRPLLSDVKIKELMLSCMLEKDRCDHNDIALMPP